MTNVRAACDARCDGAHRHVVKSLHVEGRAWKLVARATGGPGYVTLNLCPLAGDGARLGSCGMAEDHVRRFVPCTVPRSGSAK